MKYPEHGSPIAKRQFYFFQGQGFEKEEKLELAIGAYLEYSKVLEEVDKHIPHQWISQLYEILMLPEKSLQHLELYAEGISEARKAELFKDIGEKYESLGLSLNALRCYEKSISVKDQIGLKTKILKLNNQMGKNGES